MNQVITLSRLRCFQLLFPAATIGCAVAALLLSCPASSRAQSPLPVIGSTPVPVSASLGISPESGLVPAEAGIAGAALDLPASAAVQIQSTTGTNGGTVHELLTSALEMLSNDLFSPTQLAANPQSASVVLTYNLLCVGKKVLVAPLDGGTINGANGGQSIAVANDGTITFNFQAPARPGRFHVITRLGNSEIAVPFDVTNPWQSSPASAPLQGQASTK